MAWRRPGDKPLSEPIIVSVLTHICVTRTQWDNPHEAKQNLAHSLVMMCPDTRGFLNPAPTNRQTYFFYQIDKTTYSYGKTSGTNPLAGYLAQGQMYIVDSLTPMKSNCNFNYAIFKYVLLIAILVIGLKSFPESKGICSVQAHFRLSQWW